MRLGFLRWIVGLCVVVGFGGPAFGQGGEEISFARMFFWNDTFLGVVIIVVLQVLSLITVALIVQFVLAYRREKLLPADLHGRLAWLMKERQFREAINTANASESLLGRMVGAAMLEAPAGFAEMERAIEESADLQNARMVRGVEYLNVIGNIAPMLGLFGTIYGMIVAFQQLVAAGGRPDPAELAAGISTALVTTFWGLVVAMPALAGYALIRNRLDAMSAEALVLADDLFRPFKPVAGGGVVKNQGVMGQSAGVGGPAGETGIASAEGGKKEGR